MDEWDIDPDELAWLDGLEELEETLQLCVAMLAEQERAKAGR